MKFLIALLLCTGAVSAQVQTITTYSSTSWPQTTTISPNGNGATTAESATEGHVGEVSPQHQGRPSAQPSPLVVRLFPSSHQRPPSRVVSRCRQSLLHPTTFLSCLGSRGAHRRQRPKNRTKKSHHPRTTMHMASTPGCTINSAATAWLNSPPTGTKNPKATHARCTTRTPYSPMFDSGYAHTPDA
jgi:hypothetical protein